MSVETGKASPRSNDDDDQAIGFLCHVRSSVLTRVSAIGSGTRMIHLPRCECIVSISFCDSLLLYCAVKLRSATAF